MSVLPARYWIWVGAQNLYRFDAAEAERINTALDQLKGDATLLPPTFIAATDLAGSEIRLQPVYCISFRECTPATRAFDRAVDRELEAEYNADKDWSGQG